MVYYTSNGERREYEPEEKDYISSGTQGSVFRCDGDGCLKKYRYIDRSKLTPFDDSFTTFTEEVFSYFKNNKDLRRYCKLRELLYNSPDPKIREVIAYTMKYYPSIADSILFLPTEYLLESYYWIIKDVETLSRDGIDIIDFNGENFIVGSDGMTVIDFDKCRIASKESSDKESDIRKELNYQQLAYAFGNHLELEIKKLYGDKWNTVEKDVKKRIKQFLPLGYTGPFILAKEMKPYAKPIDIFYKR